MRFWQILVVVVVLMILTSTMALAETKKANTMVVRATGYYPPPKEGYSSRIEALMEGGSRDKFENRLRTLQEYKEGSYVSVAVDKRKIPLGSEIQIEQFPRVKFIACDVGKKIRGNRIDLCVANKAESYKIPRKLTVNILRRGSGYFQASIGTARANGQDGEGRVLKDCALYLYRIAIGRCKDYYERLQTIQNNNITRERICLRGIQQRYQGLGNFAAM